MARWLMGRWWRIARDVAAIALHIRIVKPTFGRPRHEIVVRNLRIVESEKWVRPNLSEQVTLRGNNRLATNAIDLAKEVHNGRTEDQPRFLHSEGHQVVPEVRRDLTAGHAHRVITDVPREANLPCVRRAAMLVEVVNPIASDGTDRTLTILINDRFQAKPRRNFILHRAVKGYGLAPNHGRKRGPRRVLDVVHPSTIAPVADAVSYEFRPGAYPRVQYALGVGASRDSFFRNPS